jgi:transposase
MQAYSLDLRQRVVDACQSGQSEREVAARFALSLASVQRYKRLHRATGSLAPKPWPGRTPKIKPEQQDALRALVDKKTDWTLVSLCEAWKAATGTAIARDVMGRTLSRVGITHKKRVASPPSATRRSARRSGRR